MSDVGNNRFCFVGENICEAFEADGQAIEPFVVLIVVVCKGYDLVDKFDKRRL
jgi:hypothetical protein